MAREWFVKFEGKEFGPYNDGQLISLAHDGSIGTATAVRQSQNGAWIEAGTVPGLFRQGSRPSPPAMPTSSTVWRAEPIAESLPPQNQTPVISPLRISSLRKNKSRTPQLVGVAIGCTLLGAAVVGLAWRSSTTDNTRTETGVRTSLTPAATDSAITSIEGKWLSEGVYLSKTFAEPAILTVRRRGGEWRDISTQRVRELTSVVPQSDGTVKVVIDETNWEAKLLPNGELQFRQPGQSIELFPNLKPYSEANAARPASRNDATASIIPTEEQETRNATHKIGYATYVMLGPLSNPSADPDLFVFLIYQDLMSPKGFQEFAGERKSDDNGITELAEGTPVQSLKTNLMTSDDQIWTVHFVKILSGSHRGKTGWICDRALLRI